VKKIVLAAVFAAAFAAGAIAQTSYPVPPRDPPFGKGGLDNNTEREPNYNGSSDEETPPRDPPFGKGDLHNEPAHLPSSASTQGKASDDPGNGEVQKSAKSKDARTKSALKKDNTKNGAKPDSTPKNDTD
jgi:hypothetical protein